MTAILKEKSEIDQLAVDNLDLVPSVMAVHKGIWRHLNRDDTREAGFEGLMQAAISYDPAKGARFRTYARNMIRWAILDYARKEAREWQKSERIKFDIVPPHIEKFRVIPRRLSGPIEMAERCMCGHAYSEHHSSMGCMHWDARYGAFGGWCPNCSGFSRAKEQ